MTRGHEQDQTSNEAESEEKEKTQKEFLDGCVGCSSLGCLPFAAVIIITVTVHVFYETSHFF